MIISLISEYVQYEFMPYPIPNFSFTCIFLICTIETINLIVDCVFFIDICTGMSKGTLQKKNSKRTHCFIFMC